jgi:poly(A) polymerase
MNKKLTEDPAAIAARADFAAALGGCARDELVDVDARVIRVVGDPHAYVVANPLRMLRVVRLMSQLASRGFALDLNLAEAIIANARLIQQVRGRLVRGEFEQILTSSHPLVGLDLMMDSGLMYQLFPELVDLNGPGGDQDPYWHPEGNTWVHSRLVVQGLVGAPFTLMMGGLLHDIGKPATQVRHADGRISNPGHDAIGAVIAKAICERLELTRKESRTICKYVAMHMTMHCGPEMRPARLARLLQRSDLPELVRLQHADATGKDGEQRSLCSFYAAAVEQMACAEHNAQCCADVVALVRGGLLIGMGYQPGPQFAVIIEHAREAQIEGVFNDVDGARIWVVDNFGEPR